jgi:hypothetical protein
MDGAQAVGHLPVRFEASASRIALAILPVDLPGADAMLEHLRPFERD